MSTGSSQQMPAHPLRTAERIRLIVFRVLATLAGAFFLVAVVLMASAPWVLLQPGQDPHADLNRWFSTVAGSVDAIAVGVWVALVHRPRRTLLVVEMSGAVIVAGAILLPFQPSAILAVAVVPLIAYPYWRDVRTFPSWWAGMSPVHCSSSPHWPVPRFSSRRLLHFPGRSAEPIRRLAGAGGRTMPSTRPCSR